MAKTNGRIFTDQTCKLKAEEIIDVIKMWGIGQADAYYIIRHMKFLCASATPSTWKNPLTDIGMKTMPLGMEKRNE